MLRLSPAPTGQDILIQNILFHELISKYKLLNLDVQLLKGKYKKNWKAIFTTCMQIHTFF